MIVLTHLICLLVTCIHVTSSMTVMDYAKELDEGMDREYTPITSSKCRFSPRHRRMKSCMISVNEPRKLRMYSDQYLNYGINRWENQRLDSLEGKGERTVSTISNLLRFYRRSNTRTRDYDDDRKRRSVNEEEESPKKKYYHRVKRRSQLGLNPCAEKKSRRTIVIHGIDAISGEIVELLHNPDHNMFQTYYTKRCKRSSFYNMKCEPQYIKFDTAVFIKGTLDVHVRPVQIPTNCALSF